MRVYHFLNEQHGLNNLRKKRLKLSQFDQLNDPFELLALEVSDRKLRKAMNATKKHMAGLSGVLCFSGNWTNPVQWAHYANRHKGICLGFDVSDHYLEEVDYVEERITLDQELNEDVMRKLLKTKFKHWEYEDEHRAFIELKEKDEDEGLYFVNFSKDIKLKQVIVGAESSITRSQLNDAIGKLTPRPEVFKARASFEKFKMVKNQNPRLWPD